MSVEADQARLVASVGKLDRAGRTVTKAIPAAVPWIITGLTALMEFADGMSLGGGDGDKDGTGGGSGADGTSGSGKGDGNGGGRKGIVGEVLSTVRDYVVGVSGGLLANRLGAGGDDHETHEESVEHADDAVSTCDRVLESIQGLCADEVEACVDGAVDTAMGLYSSAQALQATDPVAAQAMLQAAAQLLCSALDGVGTMVKGRNTQMGECMDLTIAECRPAADEGRCRVPLAADPAPSVEAPDCDVAPVPSEVSTVGASASASAAASGSAAVAPAPATAATTGAAAATAVASAGIGSTATPPAPPCPSPVSVPGLVGEISGWVKGAVEGAVTVAVENSGSLIDIDLAECPPGTPDGGGDSDCPEPVPEPEPEPVPEPEPCEPVAEPEPEEEPCEPVSEPRPEPEPDTPAPPTVDPEKGFDKSVYLQAAGGGGEASPAAVPAPDSPATPAPSPVGPAAVDAPAEVHGSPEPPGDSGQTEPPESPATYDGWTPDVWTTGEKSGDAPSVARSGQW
jgi:hypothetical protein